MKGKMILAWLMLWCACGVKARSTDGLAHHRWHSGELHCEQNTNAVSV